MLFSTSILFGSSCSSSVTRQQPRTNWHEPVPSHLTHGKNKMRMNYSGNASSRQQQKKSHPWIDWIFPTYVTLLPHGFYRQPSFPFVKLWNRTWLPFRNNKTAQERIQTRSYLRDRFSSTEFFFWLFFVYSLLLTIPRILARYGADIHISVLLPIDINAIEFKIPVKRRAVLAEENNLIFSLFPPALINVVNELYSGKVSELSIFVTNSLVCETIFTTQTRD